MTANGNVPNWITSSMYLVVNMKLKVTINIGNYSNIGLESSEYDRYESCKDEIVDACKKIKEPAVLDFCKRYFGE